MTTNNGGPAFPVPEVFDERRGEVTQYGSAGMTLRDYFAAKAMAALVCLPSWPDSEFDADSRTAYKMADAMLKERAK